MRIRRYSRVIFGIVVLALIGALAFEILKRQGGVPTPQESSHPSTAPSEAPVTPQASPEESQKATTQPTPRTSPAPAENLRLTPPDVETLRREVEADPHQAPPSLTAFARELSAKMGPALQSEQGAADLFPSLEDCVRGGPSSAIQVQTLCLGAAEELSKKYPNALRSRFQSLSQEAPPEAIRLRRALRSLSR